MDSKIGIYIVEDMAMTRASLEDKLEDNGYAIAGSKATAEAAWEEIKNLNSIDLVLLDINLAGKKNGIWLAEKIRENLTLPIVYLTAYSDENTLNELVKTKPNGYLMKPYNSATLLTTITIAIENFSKSLNPQNNASIFNIKDTIYIKDSYIRVKLIINDIYYVKSDGNYLNIYLENKRHVIRSKMSDFVIDLPSGKFCRVHQRYMVNTEKIDQIGVEHLSLLNKDIPLSARYKKELLSRLKLK